MVDSDEIKSARRDLGRTLAHAAGHTQHGFAGLVQYGRSSVANTETGRQQPDRAFWVRCDMVLQTGGALVKEYDAIVALARQQRRASALRAAARSTPVLPQADRDDGATDRQSDDARVGLSALAFDLTELSSEPPMTRPSPTRFDPGRYRVS
ncbi:helix-turn-helix transcriptional regulator [Micromonospora sp. NPDC047707]|uniref:helix-turn-helix domain-containing protein n=1 Tax=Micromonospora sp. NPDC047707 TaxID=3154498 RepID=UPI003453CB99